MFGVLSFVRPLVTGQGVVLFDVSAYTVTVIVEAHQNPSGTVLDGVLMVYQGVFALSKILFEKVLNLAVAMWKMDKSEGATLAFI